MNDAGFWKALHVSSTLARKCTLTINFYRHIDPQLTERYCKSLKRSE